MANSYAILGQLIRSSAEAANFQKNKLKELSTKDFPFSGSHLFIKALMLINEGIISVFDKFRIEFDNLIQNSPETETSVEEDFTELQQSIILHTQLIWYFNRHIHYVEQTAREYVSLATVFLVSNLTKPYTDQFYFDWDNCAKDPSSLFDFLRERFQLKLDKPTIHQLENNNSIEIISNNSVLKIELNPDKRKAVLRENETPIYEFGCKREGNRLITYSGTSIFLLTPVDKQNFEYLDIGTTLKKLIPIFPNSDKILELIPENVSVLSFPEIYRDNIVANILLAHEVGHFIVKVKNLASQISREAQIDETMLSKYVNELSSSQVGLKEQKTISHYIESERLSTLLRTSVEASITSWVEELLCDMIAFRFSGPVFVFGLSELLLSSGYYSVSTHDYPSPSYRIKFIISEIKRLKFLEYIEKNGDKENISRLLDEIESYVEISSGMQQVVFDKKLPSGIRNQEKLFDIVTKAVTSLEYKIRETAEIVTKYKEYKPEKFGKDLSKLIEKLEEVVPPCEVDRGIPSDLISILNAGIVYKMIWKSLGTFDSSNMENIQETEKNINGLVLHSIEASVFQRNILDRMKEIDEK